VLFRQFVDDDLGCASYLVADSEAREAVVVDPGYAIEKYVEEAERTGVRIVRVLETHTHADHVSGHGRLALEHGVHVSIHPAAEAAYPHDALEDGARIRVGGCTLRCIHTPGHRPEHCCFVVDEELVLTGDSLFVGDAARPDLAVEARAGSEGLFHSLQRLLELPDGVAVYPGHVAGSLCGTGMSSDPSSTIGAERLTNAALAYTDAIDFVNASAGVATPRPPNMERIVELNRGAWLAAQPPLGEVDAWEGTILDVRPPETFAAGHVRGALNVPVSGSSFATKSAFVLRPGERIALHASSGEEAELAWRRLQAVALFDVAGRLSDPTADERLDPITVAELEPLVARDAVAVLDVRELDERDSGYIAGSRHIPYRLLRAMGPEALPSDRPVVTICESGARAAIAASVLARQGVDARPVLTGGITEWEERGGRTVEFRRCGS
jgi:glyoxylase-like metal-dependent hydrolase (beta-lactamase superfamily II)/rhodanese-related sulfurtransferase